MPHASRPAQSKHAPIHVTLRVVSGVPSLRGRASFRVVRRALAATRLELGFRLVHYSVQGNHLHLIGEAEGAPALSRGMHGLCVRLARRLNEFFGRKGALFRDRYHARSLRTPLEVRRALLYVLNNHRHHAAERGLALPSHLLDPCSSAAAFSGWRTPRDPGSASIHAQRAPPDTHWSSDRGPPDVDLGVKLPQSFLLRRGWLRHGRLGIDEVPHSRGIVAASLIGG